MNARGAGRSADLTGALGDHIRLAAQMDALIPTVEACAAAVCSAFEGGHRLYALGNGGSAADAQHLVAELIGRFDRMRRPLPAVSLATDPSVVSCIGNDFDFGDVFARQVEAIAVPGDVVVAFTTSGRSPNVVRALEMARARGSTTILFASGDGALAAAHADLSLLVPSGSTARIQEMHVLLLHLLSEVVDRWAAEPTDGDLTHENASSEAAG